MKNSKGTGSRSSNGAAHRLIEPTKRMNKNPNLGVYPTMITPYNKDGKIDFGAVDKLVEWYWNKGCDGIFAACQSSEIFFLSLDERVALAKRVKEKADTLAAADGSRKAMTVVASGHISDSFADQVKELTLIAKTGVDALILISNRLDIDNTGDAKWICDLTSLIEELPPYIALGVYECPYPYKRLLTPAMIEACIKTRRFTFIKDTCCDAKMIAARNKQLDGTGVNLFNANSLTLLDSLRSGAAGFSGIMGNFHPQLYSWLCRNYKTQPEIAEKVQAFLSLASLTETMAYPCTAKYHLSEFEGIKMEYTSRARDVSQLTEYQKSCIRQMGLLARAVYSDLK